MKYSLFFLVVLVLFLEIGNVNLYPMELESTHMVDISLVDSSLTQLHQGVYEFTANI